MRSKPRLLVVPHIFAEDIRVRSIEFAHRLTTYFDVYCLQWKDAVHVTHPNRLIWRCKQIYAAATSIFPLMRVARKSNGVNYIEMPILQPLLLKRFVGLKLSWIAAQEFNSWWLKQAVRKFKIQKILLAKWEFKPLKMDNVDFYFDIVDYVDEAKLSSTALEVRKVYLREIAHTAKKTFVVSQPLTTYLRQEYGINAICLPNGTDTASLCSVDIQQVQRLREKYGLENKFVIGYIGNHGPHAGIDFLLDVYETVRQVHSDITLLIVGPVGYWAGAIRAKRIEGIIITGPIPPGQIDAYFHVIDIGIFPCDKSSFCDYAFPIKVVEYTACRKFVVSTPLLTLQELQWPNLVLVERNVDTWVQAILSVRQYNWNREWDNLVEPYDWSRLAEQLAVWIQDT